MTGDVVTIEVFWDAEYGLWKSRRPQGIPNATIKKSYNNETWAAEVGHLDFDPRGLKVLDGSKWHVEVNLHEIHSSLRANSVGAPVLARTPAAVAAMLRRDWGIQIVFRRDKFYGRDRRGRRKFFDVEPLKVVVGEQRIPSPEDP